MIEYISNTEKFMSSYNLLLQKVKERWVRADCKRTGINETKVSRIKNGQFDILTLIEMASVCNLEMDCDIKEIWH